MSVKKTDWYTGKQKPARRGVYERKFPTGTILFSYWNGRYWCRNTFDDAYRALTFAGSRSNAQSVPWRGQVSK